MRRALGLALAAAVLQGCAPAALGPALFGAGLVDYVRGLEPHRYLQTALDDMRQNAYYANQVDWTSVSRTAFDQAAGARIPGDTYPAIEAAVRQLFNLDSHSEFLPPAALPALFAINSNFSSAGITYIVSSGVVAQIDAGSPADKAGIRTGDVLLRVNGKSAREWGGKYRIFGLFGPTPFHVLIRHSAGRTRAYDLQPAPAALNYPPVGRRIGDSGYLWLPQLVDLNPNGTTGARYSSTLVSLIQKEDAQPACGWIVDLRQNEGGNVFPMAAGLSPFLGSDPFAYTVQRHARQPETVNPATNYRLKHPNAPVAVLTSPLTASSGEMIAVAFKGRPQWRSFGEPTYGASSGTQQFFLNDGALLNLMVAVDADRTGKTYGGRMPPDQPVTIDWSKFGADGDPVIVAAQEWLHSQSPC